MFKYYKKGQNYRKTQSFTIDGIKWDSKSEYEYYQILLDLKENGFIKSIEKDFRFDLPNIHYNSNLQYIENPRNLFYKCDFRVVDAFDRVHYIEYKGYLERHSHYKMAHVSDKYGIFIRIIPDKGNLKYDTSFLIDKKLDKSMYNTK